MENLEIWNKYKEVPENAMRAFDNGKFKGTDINTMWRMKSLTEQFGVCGFGWYYEVKRTWTETLPNEEVFAFAEIELFVKIGDEWSKGISGTGGNKLFRKTKSGVSSSDEAFKMAITDAFGVACKNLGIGADVYWQNDKTKYTEIVDYTPIDNTIDEAMKNELIKYNVDLLAVAKHCGVDKIDDIPKDYARRIISKHRAEEFKKMEGVNE